MTPVARNREKFTPGIGRDTIGIFRNQAPENVRALAIANINLIIQFKRNEAAII
ncbi:hypothetical protein ACVIWV_001952 [Bradyrhizobium diazoefficiens]|uniref:hypothetical protein n=1 Tax=Bradyrhizobium TaxID=374 RepID=UPI001B8D4D73|nr:hypothetical protein [Bradyrhizobium diazoefficiens]MBR0867605.1 hypothetical protein [Bradyrhizobium diazoefficiens]MBR0892233.1 hypothetical protein [Bradyrhizobium diazoefficiens]MBR0923976.1 hypothetical protein [Bradyrhizobium diazoefficiens]